MRIYNVTLPARAERTSFEALWNKRPHVTGMRVFGCKAYMQMPAHQRKRFDSKSTVGTMDGYSLDSKAYRILHRDKIGRMTVSEFRNVSFDEHSKGLFIDPLSYGSVFSDVPGNIGELPPANQVADHVGVTPGQHPAVTAPIPALMVVPPPGDEGSIDGVKAALMGHMACKPVDLHLTQLT